jgi:hypothetical protein
MAWTVPDKGEGDNDVQSILFQEYLDVLVAGLSGTDCVLSGCAITGGADMTPAVAKGAVLSNGTLFAVTAGDVTIGAADATNPRIDLIVVNSSGAKAVRAGTAAANPKPPARTANDVVLGAVYVPAADTSIETTKITDMRVFPQAPIPIYKQTTQRTQNNSTSAVSLFSNGSGLTIPNGLFLTGKVLRVRTGGNVLHNTTTGMTITVIITYGGTTIFQDVGLTYGTTADADRMPWRLDFDLIAAASNLQRMYGHFMAAGPTITAPTTGLGDIATDELLGNSPIAGPTAGIAVDSDAADRVLNITFTMSAANASHEWTCDGMTVELL